MLKAKQLALWVFMACFASACDHSKESLSVEVNTQTPPSFIEQQGDQFKIVADDIVMSLKPMIGGRIASLKLGDVELLQTYDPHHNFLWGSVLWSSPQNEWIWPPVEVLDSKPYQVTVEDDALLLSSAIDEKTGYQFLKRHSLVTGASAIRLTYSIVNHSADIKQVAPWEVTRFPIGGTTLFPKGERDFDSGIFYALPVETLNNIVWHKYDEKRLQNDHHKLMTDGKEGWLAYVINGYLVVKQFDDVPDNLIAKNEGEIELFANAEKTCMELEHQGPLTELHPGEELTWEVIWHVKKLPESLSTEVGSEALVEYIRKLLI